jgi:hypothetical protein
VSDSKQKQNIMKKIIFLIFTLFTVGSTLIAQGPDFAWAKSIGSSVGGGSGRSIAVDVLGNTYTCGYFTGVADFNPGAATYNLTSNGETDIFIQKLDVNGDFVWAHSIGGSEYDRAFGIAVDGSGNVYTTGDFNGTLDFNPDAGTFNLVATGIGPRDIFIQKLDANGNFIWAKSMGSNSSDDHTGAAIAVDGSGNVYTTGFFIGVVDFNPGTGVSNLNSNGNGDIFVQKLDVNGNFVWAKSVGGTHLDRGLSIAVDLQGDVLTTGYFQFTVDFDPGSGVTDLTSVGDNDIFIQKLDANGNFVWAKSMGSIFNDTGNSITVDASGSVYTTGYFDNAIDIDPGAGISTLITHGATDVFIQKLDVNGGFVWANSMGTSSSDAGASIRVDALGNIYTAGYYQGTGDFDPGAATNNLTSNNGSRDIFIQKLDASGDFVWISSVGGNGTDQTSAIEIDPSGSLYTTGYFNNGVDFNPGTGVSNLFSNGASADIFIQKLMQCKNTGIDSQIACNSFTWIDGNTYASSNSTATHTLTNVAGCDSIVTLNLTITNSNTGTDVQTACNTFTWIDGNTYTSSNNTATYTLTNVAGCDSLVTLNLAINNSNTGMDVQTACNTFTWIDGNTYTNSNSTATYTLTNVIGCDSIVTLNLTIMNSNTGTDMQTACNTFTWIDGQTYTNSNNAASYTVANVAGCDSVVTLNLIINNSNTGTDIQTACNTFTWIDGNTYTNSNNIATYILTNNVGCDSVVTLDLTINSNTGVDVQTSCDTYTWIDGITYTSSNNIATHTLTNVAGCDSIVTLNLVINTVDIGTSLAGATISVNNNLATSYQWINCIDNSSVLGVTNGTFTATSNGEYAVVITENTCTDTSVCVTVSSVSLNVNETKGFIKVYPSPVQNELFIELNNQAITKIDILDLSGKIVKSINTIQNSIDISDLNQGIYVLTAYTQYGISNTRFVKK